jgi:NADPH-dependent ferric siderophore reductase
VLTQKAERTRITARVSTIIEISAHMRRITIGGGGVLEGFPVSLPAQWVKVFVPSPETEQMNGRAYTIRSFSQSDAEMTIDFVLHGGGPCSWWAENAEIGDIIQIAGPRRGFKLDPEVRHLLVGGDETALPAIGSILEALPACITVQAFVEVPDERDVQSLRSKADVSVAWLPRGGDAAGTSTVLQDAMIAAKFPDDVSAVWFAGEAAAVRVVRQHFQVKRGLDRRRITSSGYWKKGETAFRDAERDQ